MLKTQNVGEYNTKIKMKSKKNLIYIKTFFKRVSICELLLSGYLLSADTSSLVDGKLGKGEFFDEIFS